MLLKSLKLENIRSHANSEIKFPSGSILLSGDIGAGKSSILLAIEFALFGIMKGDLSGESLLRRGAKEGSVELKFEIDGQEYLIKRYLKRGKDGISQESGFIMHDDIKNEGTAVELKAKILNILGYPKDLLTKSKSLIYRYTVYTPQEEMKKILTEDDEQRLNTLRKVFGIDKYKQIIENSAIVKKEIRERKKELEGKIYDLNEKQKQRKSYEKLIIETKRKINELLPKISEIKKQKENKKAELLKIEGDIKKLNVLNKNLASLETELKEKNSRIKKNNERMEIIKKEIAILKEKILPEKIEKIKNLISNEDEIKKKIKEKEEILMKTNSSIKECEVNKHNSEKIKNQISKMTQCIMCLQPVSNEHKHRINYEEDEKIKLNENLLVKYYEEKKRIETDLKILKEKFEEIIKNKGELIKFQAEIANLEEKNRLISELSQENEQINKEITRINSDKLQISEEIENLKNVEMIYSEIKEELEKIMSKEKDLEIEHARYDNEMNSFNRMILNIETEIQNKIKAKEKIQKLSQTELWLDEYFINLMSSMEKSIMGKLYHEFNELFQNWFNILIDDHLLNVRLDEQFTPIIEQNGFETTIENLSGGEKTSVALAYRLALNKVINDLVSEIKTKDLIILDEPTDGFSSEQLDKVRDVLRQLNTKQTILVSHEPKIESYVDNIIRINKNDHVSSLVQ